MGEKKISIKRVTNLIASSATLALTYLHIPEKFFKLLYNESFLVPYINDDAHPEGLKHTIEHALRSHTSDFLGSFALASLTDLFLSKTKFREYSAEISSLSSFLALSSVEFAQALHIIPGVYDNNDVITYFLGAAAYYATVKVSGLYKNRKRRSNYNPKPINNNFNGNYKQKSLYKGKGFNPYY